MVSKLQFSLFCEWDLYTKWQIEDKRIESRNPSRERGSNSWSISFPLRPRYDGWKRDSNFVQGDLFPSFPATWDDVPVAALATVDELRWGIQIWSMIPKSCVMSSYLSTSLPSTLQKSVRLYLVTHFECGCRLWKTPMRRTCTIN